MKRRENVANGYVNFPMFDPQYKNSNEGGMIVKLVVFNESDVDDDDNFELCTGVYVNDFLTESFVGCDSEGIPRWDDREDFIVYSKRVEEIEERFFPNMNIEYSDTAFNMAKYAMRPSLCSLVIGNTGWSGWNTIDDVYWKCSYNDLTDAGKDLYSYIQKLYGPKASLHLLTFLDT